MRSMKRPQFSLRTLFVLVTLAGIACAAVVIWPMRGMIEAALMFLVLVSLPVLDCALGEDWSRSWEGWRDWWRKKSDDSRKQ